MDASVERWDAAPDGTALDVGECGAVDGDRQGCARPLFHPRSPHQHTGLRRWLETTEDHAVIRFYEGSRCDELEAMESPVFEALGFVAVARGDVERTTSGASGVWTLFAGLLAGAKTVVRLRAVCDARR